MLLFDEAEGFGQEVLVYEFNVTVTVDDIYTAWEILCQLVVALVDLGEQLLPFKLETVEVAAGFDAVHANLKRDLDEKGLVDLHTGCSQTIGKFDGKEIYSASPALVDPGRS